MRAAAAAISMFMAANCVAADKPFEFRGVRLGVSEAEFTSSLPAYTCTAAGPYLSHLADRICTAPAFELEYAGVAASSIIAGFLDNRFIALTVSIKPDQFDAVSAALREKFGAPTLQTAPEFRTRGGVVVRNETLTWQHNGDTIMVRRYGSSLDSTNVMYMDGTGREMLSKRQRDSAKNAVKSM